MSDHDAGPLFETLEPPPGGVTRLRARIRRERRRRSIRNGALALATASLVIVALTLPIFLSGNDPAFIPPGLGSDLMAIRLGLVEPPAEVVSVRPDLRRQYAVRQVPTRDERVVFYLVGSR